MSRTLLLLLVGTIVITLACSPGLSTVARPSPPAAFSLTPTPAPAWSAEGEEKAKRVNALFTDFVALDSPGAAVIVIQDGKILYQAGYGLANVKKGRAITPQTIFHMASTSKQFTALAIMMLTEEGKLKYDDLLSKHLPELARLKGVTLRQLLQHTSGLEDDDEALTEAYPAPTHADLLAWLADNGELSFTPGEEFEYSNRGYEILGLVVERLSGQSYGAFLQARVFDHLGMRSTFVYDPARLDDPDRATGYEAESGQFTVSDSDPMDNLLGSGSTYSTVADFYLYDQALYTDELVKQSTLAEAFQPAPLNDGREEPYGFAWDLGEYHGATYVGHSGEWLGFVSYILRFPELKFSVALFSNRTDTDVDNLPFQIADIYWPAR